MKARLNLIFPYLCALLVVGLLAWRNGGFSISPAHALPDFSAYVDPVCRMEVGTGIEMSLCLS